MGPSGRVSGRSRAAREEERTNSREKAQKTQKKEAEISREDVKAPGMIGRCSCLSPLSKRAASRVSRLSDRVGLQRFHGVDMSLDPPPRDDSTEREKAAVPSQRIGQFLKDFSVLFFPWRLRASFSPSFFAFFAPFRGY